MYVWNASVLWKDKLQQIDHLCAQFCNKSLKIYLLFKMLLSLLVSCIVIYILTGVNKIDLYWIVIFWQTTTENKESLENELAKVTKDRDLSMKKKDELTGILSQAAQALRASLMVCFTFNLFISNYQHGMWKILLALLLLSLKFNVLQIFIDPRIKNKGWF